MIAAQPTRDPMTYDLLRHLAEIVAENRGHAMSSTDTSEKMNGVGHVRINRELVEQAPEKMPEIVRSMHHTAAQAIDDAATLLEREMQSHIQLMRDEADHLRNQGDGQAATIEALSLLIREAHNTFQVQADKLTRFRANQIPQAK